MANADVPGRRARALAVLAVALAASLPSWFEARANLRRGGAAAGVAAESPPRRGSVAAWAAGRAAPPRAPADPSAPAAHLDDWSARELRCLPGLGAKRARAVALARAGRGGHLPLAAFESLQGLGPVTAQGVREALLRATPARPPPGDGQNSTALGPLDSRL